MAYIILIVVALFSVFIGLLAFSSRIICYSNKRGSSIAPVRSRSRLLLNYLGVAGQCSTADSQLLNHPVALFLSFAKMPGPSSPKSNLDLINECDQSPPNPHLLYTFKLSGLAGTYGHLLQETARAFTWRQDYWKVDHEAREVVLLGTTEEERTLQMRETLLAEKDKATFQVLSMWTGEVFPIYGPKGHLLMSIERIAAPLFGVTTYGVQLLAYTENDNNEVSVWVARRAKTKRTFPGMLDSTVGGSLRTGETPFECLVRESEEEASFEPDYTRTKAISVGTINYLNLTDERSKGEKGLLCPETQFTYEMKIAPDHIPIPGDGEAEEIILMSVNQLKVALAGGEFTPANGEVVLDFFIRHGILTFENETDYATIVARLHRSHEFTK
jgi:8-oxo-dGTP pyrophosphatase MutT (NUDIX family)